MTQRTESEVLFEQFCAELEIECIPVPRAGGKTPDYDLVLSGHTIVTELKQCDLNDEDKNNFKDARTRGTASAWSLPGRRIRRKIQESSKQLKARSKGSLPAMLVVYDNGTFGGTDSNDIKTAMFGNETVSIAHRDGFVADVSAVHPGPGRKMTSDCNTTISAIALLFSKFGPNLSLSVFHNHFAANPITPNWFRDDRFHHFALNTSCYEWEEI